VQSPFFFALYRVLYNLKNIGEGRYGSIGPINKTVAQQAERADLFGAPLSSTFVGADGNLSVQIVTVVLIVLMSVTTFTTQRQLTMKNMPQAAKDNPMFRTQKIMLYMMPLVFAISGVNFPIGVLVYWLTTNLWSMGQQFFVIRRMPSPGSEAEKKMLARKERKKPRHGEEETDSAVATDVRPAGQRVQPKKQSRSQRRSGPLQASNPSPADDAPRKEIEPADLHEEVEPKPAKGPVKPPPLNKKRKRKK
jgi:YidC/Oxa1 family membrane protein insertase